MFLLLNVGAFEVLRHHEPRSVIRAFELHFIHQCADDLESPASRAFCLADRNRGGRLSISPAKRFALVGHGDYKPIVVDCEMLMYFSVGTVAVLGSVDARLDQRGLDLVDRLLIEVSRASYLLGGARGD